MLVKTARTSRPLSSYRATALWAALGLAVAAGVVPACGSTVSGGGGTGLGPGTGSGGAGGGDAGPSGPTARELFDEVEPDLVKVCGLCHKEGGSADIPFLAGKTTDERYTSITSWPGIILKEAHQSILLTHPGDPSHGGGEAPDLPADLRPRVEAWLEAEAASLPDGGGEIGPTVTPFKPLLGGAFNTIYLGGLGPDFEYMSISFNAKAFGGTSDSPTMLRLTNLTVHTVPDKPLHIVHPLFTVYYPAEAPDPDPVDSFSNLDQTFTIDTDPTLGTGELVLTNWRKGAYLGVAFQLIEVYGGNAGGDGACKDLATFQQNVVPALQYCASKCHGGGNPQAKGTMDLSELSAAMPTAACLQVRARIKPGDPDNSPVLVVTNPLGVVVHMYKFEGDLNAYGDFKTKVTPWIMAEQ